MVNATPQGTVPRMAHLEKDREKLLARTRKIRGQLNAVDAVIVDGEDCSTVLMTLAASANAAGVMTLAVMSRASLGHTGQQLTASVATQGIYAAIVVAALARICAVLEPTHSVPLLHVAAFCWAAAFLGFALGYGPSLVGWRKRAAQTPAVA